MQTFAINSFMNFCKDGNAKALKSFAYYPLLSKISYSVGFNLACENKHYDLANLLIEMESQFIITLDIHYQRERIFRGAFRRNDTKLVKMLLSLESTHGQIDIHAQNECAFIAACYHRNFELIQLLLSLEPTHGKIDIHAVGEYVFLSACKYDNLEVINLLLSLEPTHGQINIHTDDEFAFRQVCYTGNINLLKLLLSLESTHRKINIHVDEDQSFIYACKKQDIEFVKLLLSLEPTHGPFNIHADEDEAFLSATSLELQFLLIKHDPNYDWNSVEKLEYKMHQYKKEMNKLYASLALAETALVKTQAERLDLNVMLVVTDYVIGTDLHKDIV